MSKAVCRKSRKAVCGVVLMAAVLAVVTGCGSKKPEALLIGMWDVVETTIDRDLVGDRVEYLKDGTALSEAENVRGVGAMSVTYTWRIDGEGRLISTLPGGITQVSTIVDISKSMHTLESNVPEIGLVRTIYARRGAKISFQLNIEASPVNGGTVSPSGAMKHNVGTEVEVTATAADGYVFIGWSGDIGDIGDSTITVIMSGNKTLTAKFEKIMDTFTDSRDGKEYRTVRIGNHRWLAENLNFEIDGASCYDNSADSCAKYGRLYIWHVAKTACPAEWRLPNHEEWSDLVGAAGGAGGRAGRKLKSTTGWNNDGNGIDSLGFSALPGGGLTCDDYDCLESTYKFVGNSGIWWGAMQNGRTYRRFMNTNRETVVADYGSNVNDGYSVRCIRD